MEVMRAKTTIEEDEDDDLNLKIEGESTLGTKPL